MTKGSGGPRPDKVHRPGPGGAQAISPEVPHAARVYDYFLGYDNNFEIDRQVAIAAAEAAGGIENARSEVRANRRFLGKAVRYVIAEAGIRQFLDIGTGIPNDDNVHAVAQQTAPEARIVYVDNDPVVLAHAHKLLASTPQGATAYHQADFDDLDDILAKAEATLDFSEPVAVLLVGLLHHFTDDEDPWARVRRLLGAVIPGSYLVVSHVAADIQPDEMAAAAEQLARMEQPMVPRPVTEVARFFDGLAVVAPGVVPVDEWRPDDNDVPPPPGWENPLYVGVGRKP